MAWLSSAPKRGKNDSKPLTRAATLKDGNTAKSLPDANPYIVMCFNLLGRCTSGGMGRSPLSWQEVKAFSTQSGYSLSGWDSEQLINMSREYCNTAHLAEELNCPAPYRENIDDEDELQSMRDNVSKQLDKFFA